MAQNDFQRLRRRGPRRSFCNNSDALVHPCLGLPATVQHPLFADSADVYCYCREFFGSTSVFARAESYYETIFGEYEHLGYFDIGDMGFECSQCNALLWFEERAEKKMKHHNVAFSLCCSKGAVRLPLLNRPPPLLWNLVNGVDARSTHFMRHIRLYNNMFSFTSLGCKLHSETRRIGGPPQFVISGQNYHNIGSLLPHAGELPKFAQLYIYDTDNEVSNRLRPFRDGAASDGLDQTLVGDLMVMLDNHNVLAKAFRQVRDIFRTNSNADVSIRLIRTRANDSRLYNLPVVDEVAGLYVGDFDSCNLVRDIIIRTRADYLQRISETHPSYLPLQYPILFPFGEDGFKEDIPRAGVLFGVVLTARDRVSLREFIAFRLHLRRTEESMIFKSGRLFQQFVVDCYTMIESQRLFFIRQKQNEIRSEVLKGLEEAVDKGDFEPATVGKRVILPSYFVGGKRYMFNNCQDAMAISRSYGYPDLFLTFTCNPKWPEIDRYMLQHNVCAADRPDIVCRIFHIKLEAMMDDLRRGHVFGELRAGMYTVEFQKRGLPHAHILVWLHPDMKANPIKLIDSVIVAEIPDPVLYPKLYLAVSTFMMHGPCGIARKTSPCMHNGRCSKFYPRRYSTCTFFDDAGYPVYLRRDTGVTVNKNGIILDNAYVVPYNPYLILKYYAHINVEYCNQSHAIKYLFKYVSKGPDRVTAVVDFIGVNRSSSPVVDEIKQYYDCRYLSPCESIWRIFKFEIHVRWPSVQRLTFHLEGEQVIYFKDTERIDDVVARSSELRTMFLAWMESNRIHDVGRSLTYSQYPSLFVYSSERKSWHLRKKGLSVGRLNFVPPGSGDLYFLRMLLNVQRGSTSFEDIRTVAGVVYSTYEEACSALGLLTNDNEFVSGIVEASLSFSAVYLRRLFVTLLLSNSMARPHDVFQKTVNLLCDDIRYLYSRQNPGVVVRSDLLHNACLHELEMLLQQHGKSLKDFVGMPDLDVQSSNQLFNVYIQNELNYDLDEMNNLHGALYSSLNTDQLNAYDAIISSVNATVGRFFFVYGSGGTGKTFLWRALSCRLRSERKIVLNVASSGIASLLLPGGRTAHSLFMIPLNLTEDSCCNIKQGSLKAELLIVCSLIIWDEAPMVNRWAFEALDRTLRDLMRFTIPGSSTLPFGGKTVVLGGDFRQILPVIPKGNRATIVMSAINSSYLWQSCLLLKLSQNMRIQSADDTISSSTPTTFAQWIIDVGDGVIGSEIDGEFNIDLPSKFVVACDVDPIDAIVQATYPLLLQCYSDFKYLEERAILAPRLDAVDKINEYILALLPGEPIEYLSSDTMAEVDDSLGVNFDWITAEFLNDIKCSGIPNHKLQLKVGAPVMLTRNIDQTAGLCNGTRLIVTNLGKNIISARVVTGTNVGDSVLIPRMNLISSDPYLPIKFCRRQYPLTLCFAMTINKSQGQTLSTVGLYLHKPVFSHGQLYVALSRVTSSNGLKILIIDDDGCTSQTTKNVVYSEVFQKI